MAETHTQGGDEMKDSLEYYLVHDQVPEELRAEIVDLYDDGEYRRALELVMNHW